MTSTNTITAANTITAGSYNDGLAVYDNGVITGLTTIANVSGTSTFATIDINGGNIDNTTIGASTAAAGTFSVTTAATINCTGTIYGVSTLNATNIQATSANLTGTTTLATLNATNANISGTGTITTADINGGAIDNTTIGASAAAAVSGTLGTFSTINCSGTIYGTTTVNATNISASNLITATNTITGGSLNDGTAVYDAGIITGVVGITAATATIANCLPTDCNISGTITITTTLDLNGNVDMDATYTGKNPFILDATNPSLAHVTMMVNSSGQAEAGYFRRASGTTTSTYPVFTINNEMTSNNKPLLNIVDVASSTSVGDSIYINRDGTGAGKAINIDYEGTDRCLYIDYGNTQSALPALEIDHAGTNTYGIHCDTAGYGVYFQSTGNIANSVGLYVACTNTGNAFRYGQVIDFNATGGGYALLIDAEGSDSIVYIDDAGIQYSSTGAVVINCGGTLRNAGCLTLINNSSSTSACAITVSGTGCEIATATAVSTVAGVLKVYSAGDGAIRYIPIYSAYS
jgi:hypothetical protein